MCRFLHVAFLFLLAALPIEMWAQGGIDFHPIVGKTYVIMNTETGEFLYRRASQNSGDCPALTDDSHRLSSDIMAEALWGIEPTGDNDFSYLIYNIDGSNHKYVQPDGDYYNLIQSSAKGYSAYNFYFLRSPYNREGYMVSHKPNFKKYLWYIAYYNELAVGTGKYAGYWLYDSQDSKLGLPTDGKFNSTNTEKALSSFRFLTYEDLKKMYDDINSNTGGTDAMYGSATLSTEGVDESTTSPSASNYYALINAIRSFATANRYQPIYNQKTGTDRDAAILSHFNNVNTFVIKSRRFDTYLARKRNGTIYLSKSINDDCIWTLIEDGGKYALISTSNADNSTSPYLTIGGTDSKYGWIDICASSDCNPKYCSLTSSDHTKKLISFYPGTVSSSDSQYEENLNSTTSNNVTTYSQNIPADWVTCSDWKFVAYDEKNNEHTALSDDQLYKLVTDKTIKTPFFRIENEGYSQEDRGAGWLADVDHVDEIGENHFLASKDVSNKTPLITGMPWIDITSTTESKAWAPNLWRIECVRKGTGNGTDFPIGIVSATPHNLYKIKNANSGKYICVPSGWNDTNADSKDDANRYFTLSSDETTVAYFWLVSLGNGEYALALRNPANNTSLYTSDGDPLGYAVIRSSFTVNLQNKSTNKTDQVDIGPYTAGLYLQTTKPTAESTGAFGFEQAFTLEAYTADNNETSGATPDQRYVTLYYPFDVVLSSSNYDGTALYYPVWTSSEERAVAFKKIDYLPANTGGIVFTPYNNGVSEIITLDLNPTASTTNITDDVFSGVTEAENLWFENSTDAINKVYPTAEMQETASNNTDTRWNYLVFSSWEYDKDKNYGTKLGLFHPINAYPMTNRCYIDLTRTTPTSNIAAYTYLYNQYKANNSSTAKGSLIPLYFADVPSGIARVNIHEGANDNAWYDLQGRRTWFPTRGIYIHNGKKILIK
jgi:hypothetical protein